MRLIQALTGLGLMVLVTTVARADELEIYVAPAGSPARAAAEARADQPGTRVTDRLHKALADAAEALAAKGPQVVTVRIAGGELKGKLGAGTWALPTVDNPQAVLRILGGFDATFSRRTPFETPTMMTTAPGRSGPVLAFGARSTLREVVLSGLVFDATPSNAYDAKSDSLLKGSSRTYGFISFDNLATDQLVVSDNVFWNGPHGTFEPAIRPLSADTVVEIRNNFFVNNVLALKVGSGLGYRGNTVRTVRLTTNTFVRNWPYNPDPTSGLVAAVNLDNKQSAQRIEIDGNLFAFNPGGALQQDWPEERMPAIALRGNLFYKNASLFGRDEAGAGALVGKFGLNPTYLVLTDEDVASETGYEVARNLSIQPSIDLAPGLEVAEDGDDLAVQGYAPRLEFAVGALPFPGRARAQRYGVQREAVWSPDTTSAASR